MHSTVRENWLAFNSPLEGRVPWMYLDVRGLVSTGMGNLIDTSQGSSATAAQREASLRLAQEFEWRTRNGNAVATAEEVATDWDTVKGRQDLAPAGHKAFESMTFLHLEDDEIDRIVFAKLDQMEAALKSRVEFRDFDDWPADAQLATLSMSWGMGPGFKFPKFQRFVATRDWEGAAGECTFTPNIGTIVKRNELDVEAFRNAARVEAERLDPTVLLLPVGGSPGTSASGMPVPAAAGSELSTLAQVQQALADLGYDPGPIDGRDGPKTSEAVRAFQADHGLDVDGKAGPATKAGIREALDTASADQ